MSPAKAGPQPRPGVLDIEAYSPGKSEAQGGAKLHKLSSNESPLGASPLAIEAYKQALEIDADKNPPDRLVTLVMQKRARLMLDRADEKFLK